MSERIAVSWEHCFPLRLNATSAKYFFRVSRLTELSLQIRGLSGSPDSLALPILTAPEFLVGNQYQELCPYNPLTSNAGLLFSFAILKHACLCLLFECRSLCFASPNGSDLPVFRVVRSVTVRSRPWRSSQAILVYNSYRDGNLIDFPLFDA